MILHMNLLKEFIKDLRFRMKRLRRVTPQVEKNKRLKITVPVSRWTTNSLNNSNSMKIRTHNSSHRNWKTNKINKCSLDLKLQHSKYLTNKISILTASSERMFQTPISLLILEIQDILKTIREISLFPKWKSWEFSIDFSVFLFFHACSRDNKYLSKIIPRKWGSKDNNIIKKFFWFIISPFYVAKF